MIQLLLILHVVISLCLIGLVLIQQGKGASMGAAFGSGASGTVFGSKGSGGFLMRVTAGFAIAFFITSLALTYIANKQSKAVSANQTLLNQAQISVPLQPSKKEQ